MSKNIVICYDGTGQEFGATNTNVVKLFRNIFCEDDKQIAFYDPGVGTFNPFNPGTFRNKGRRIGILLGNAFGWGLETNLREGYRYLMNYYQEGDHIYLFGFSRGAYTARALAGMIYYFGILEKGSDNLIPYVSKHYTNKNFELAPRFKKTFCKSCEIHFIGVWDTVKSLDYFGREKFYDAELKENVTHGYQAMSIDEKRSKFRINRWNESLKKPHQIIEQVWFPGVHSDVGGGYAESGLSDIALAWLVDKSIEHGLILKENWSSELNQEPSGTIHRSYKGWWKLLGTYSRHIREGDLIHQSVIDRQQLLDDYAPSLPQDYSIVVNENYTRGKSDVTT